MPKIKYPKLRLSKPSTSGSSGSSSSSITSVVVPLENGNDPKESISSTVEKMEQEVICLLDDEAKITEEPTAKRSRLANLKLEAPQKSKLPKIPKKPPDGGKDIVSKFFRTSEDDFETEKNEAVPKQKTKVQRQTAAKSTKPRAPRKAKKQSDIRKVFAKYKDNDEQLLQNLMLEHTAMEQLDPEQFQIALAMSRSLVDQGGSHTSMEPDQEPGPSTSEHSISSQERRFQGIRTTLEQYGFKCKNSYNDYDLNVIFGNGANAGPKNVKKIKHNRASLLKKRDRLELIAFMEKRTDEILKDQFYQKIQSSSSSLRQNYGGNVFWMNQNAESSSEKITEYYIENLVEETTVEPGYLLKKWSMIPGREPTPEKRPPNKISMSPIPAVDPPEEAEELLENPEDALLDMYSVPQEYTKMYNNEAPIYVRKSESMDKSISHPKEQKVSEQLQRTASPDLFGSDSEAEVPANEDEDQFGSVKTIEETTDEDLMIVPSQKHSLPAAKDVEPVPAEDPAEVEAPLLCTSSENIFDDTVDDQILGYEMYSSEEVKILSNGPANDTSFDHQQRFDASSVDHRTESSQELSSRNALLDDGVITISSGESFDKNVLQRDEDCGSPAKKPRLSGEIVGASQKKEEISIQSVVFEKKSSRVSFGKVESVQLDEIPEKDESLEETSFERDKSFDEKSFDNLAPAGLEDSRVSKCSNYSEDDVLVVSDDEVNYSVRHDLSILCNTSRVDPYLVENKPDDSFLPRNINDECTSDNKEEEDDLDCTNVYFNDEFKNRLSDVNLVGQVTEDVQMISSEDEEEKETNKSSKAENTMMYLDNLVKRFNLPLSKPDSNCDKEPQSAGLGDYLENYEIPDFEDHSVVQHLSPQKSTPPELQPKSDPPTSENLDQEIEQILSQVKQTCTQLDKAVEPPVQVKRTLSDSALLKVHCIKKTSSTSSSKTTGSSFRNKFPDLTEEAAPFPEFEISLLDNREARPDYAGMASPVLHRELYKYGLKQLRREKAVAILNHIYDQLHPYVEVVEIQEFDYDGVQGISEGGLRDDSITEKEQPSSPSKKIEESSKRCPFTSEMTDEEYVLPSKPRKRTFWCPVPLNIAFFNMVQADSRLQQQILRYQPVDLDAIYAHLKQIGLRYESNDLIAFLDKRCITFRTAQSSGSRTKKSSAGATQSQSQSR
ncbi:structure-specific endonuclease subunit SLX4 [Uranotaenia lowii]|uniref:structure-specific endonuclease subunit SLX4 n=1 Tax=Uranotaenia lowii TaxID=190385 RepID=UPI00247B16FD|nr:structure-specific endonuclease subunit SLX4 [Uranotaenia lowii]